MFKIQIYLTTILKKLKLYKATKIIVKNITFFFQRYRIFLKSRLAKFECHYTDFQIEPGKEIVAVIVSCYNHLKYSEQFFDSYIRSINADYNHVLVVMDDNSTDQTKAFFLEKIKKIPNICYFRYKKTMGLTQTWNNGVSFALNDMRAHYIFLVNNDIIIPKGVFNKLVVHLKDNKSIGAIGPLTNTPGYVNRQNIRQLYPHYVASDAQQNIQAIDDTIKENKPIEHKCINGFFMGFPRQTFENNIYSRFFFKSFYFNPLNINVGNEDEFLSRIKLTGSKIIIAADVFVFHYKDISQLRFQEGDALVYRKQKN